MKIKVIIVFIYLFIVNSKLFAQEIDFSQFFNTKLYFNPIDAASFEGHDAYMIYRSQWQGLPDPFVSMQFSTSHAVLKRGSHEDHVGGYGLEVHNFNAGPSNISSFGVSINPAYNLYVNTPRSNKVVFGLKVGYQQKSVGLDKLTWGTQYNPNIGFDEGIASTESNFAESSGAVTVGAGLGFYFNHKSDHDASPYSWHIKLAGLNFNRPDYTLSGVQESSQMLISSEFGFHYLFHEKLLIGTDILFLKQGDNQMVNPGLNFSYIINDEVESIITPSWIKFGTSYRLNNAIVGLVGIGSGAYRINFSYDYNASKLGKEGSGYNAYEISIGIKFIKAKHVDANPYNNRHSPRI